MLTSSLGVRSLAWPGGRVGDEEMAPLPFVPRGPVADHQMVKDSDLVLGRLFLLVLGRGLLGGLPG